jgi:plastocyanin|tara:strand:+ start:1289 stop:2029 length:741 start_codon:yes stop_codon:yes gene_type:complete
MKNFKHLFFLSILCSLVLFNACSEDEDPAADNIVLDTDGDGVADADDTCADTPSGATVDTSGCADSQRDTDGDGVTDDLDTCADTSEGATVDENGCADSQKDTDGDGVKDDLDTCSDTSEGATVDENGCSSSQIDTDEGNNTFSLDVTATSSADYTLNGSDRDGEISGNDPDLTFKVGDVISFSVNAAGHPFYLKTTAVTGTGDGISGVTNNGATEDTVSWTPDSPGTYYYQCSLHGGMVGTITIQ